MSFKKICIKCKFCMRADYTIYCSNCFLQKHKASFEAFQIYDKDILTIWQFYTLLNDDSKQKLIDKVEELYINSSLPHRDQPNPYLNIYRMHKAVFRIWQIYNELTLDDRQAIYDYAKELRKIAYEECKNNK